MSLDGVLIVDKPAGPTSHDVVATARRALKLNRIGHTGTLDPLASGVLALVLGQATRLSQFLTASEKEYEATVRFGAETDTYDRAGRIVAETGAVPTRDQLIAALDRFRGVFEQVPPAYSAKKIGGDRAYDLARGAQAVMLAPVSVETHALELLAFEPPRARLRLVCSAGFYVRSLAHELGQAVGTGALLDDLRRLRSGTFTLADAVPFGEVATGTASGLSPRLVPMERLLTDWPAVELLPTALRKIAHGQELRPSDWRGSALGPADANVRVLGSDGRLLALAKPARTAGFLQPAVVFRYN